MEGRAKTHEEVTSVILDEREKELKDDILRTIEHKLILVHQPKREYV